MEDMKAGWTIEVKKLVTVKGKCDYKIRTIKPKKAGKFTSTLNVELSSEKVLDVRVYVALKKVVIYID